MLARRGETWPVPDPGVVGPQQADGAIRYLDIAHAGLIVHRDRSSSFTIYTLIGQRNLEKSVQLRHALRDAKVHPELGAFHGWFKGEGQSLFLDAQILVRLAEVVGERM